jgi:DNA polymerase elongation subunit (family B)
MNDIIETEKDDNIKFQVLDWTYFNDETEEINRYGIRLFGRNDEGKSVVLQVDNFKPYFYVEIHDNWNNRHVKILMDFMRTKIKEDLRDGLCSYKIEEHSKLYGFTNNKKFKFIKMVFENMATMKAYSYKFMKPLKIYELARAPFNFNIYESEAIPFLRFMHIKNINGVGWIKIKLADLEKLTYKLTCCDYEYITEWTSIEPVDSLKLSEIIIGAFDIECYSIDGSFPNPERDEDTVTQIGLSLSKFGHDECYEKYVLSLKETDDVEGIIIKWFETEEELLLGFTKLIKETNPDIVTGYNTFGFDYEYLKKRAIKLKILPKFSRLSRIIKDQSEFKEDDLKSAALGSNKLKYFNMVGRINIDLMKVIQREYKLSSYKLDDVASNFIKDKIVEIINEKNNVCLIKTKNTYGLSDEQYISILYNDGIVEEKYGDGKKFQIIELKKDYMRINGQIDMDIINGYIKNKNKLLWCSTKDDVSPQQIFKLFEGTTKDRAKLAKYCIQDCVLCNKLIKKLSIIENSVGMANVCNIPLSFLFLRGQGIKIYSLMLKQCMEEGYLIINRKKTEKKKDEIKTAEDINEERKRLSHEKFINSLNRNYNNDNYDSDSDDEDESGYEGATVFPPENKIHYDPTTVLDFASLYPNIMILYNLSHEFLVLDDTMRNLDDYIYHEMSYKRNDGSEKNCTFAEPKNGKKGIIPRLLQKLLMTRKKYKKMMEIEEDPFVKKLLEGLQLAYKVVANSVYGQTGSEVGNIYMKEIAASTTSAGRQMLLFSKHFIEFIFAEMIDHALNNRDEYFKYMENLYKYYPHKLRVNEVEMDDKKIIHIKKTNITVNSMEYKEIPLNNFCKKEIGFEINEKLYVIFNDIFKIINYNDENDFNNIFIKSLYNYGVIKRRKFYNSLVKLIETDNLGNLNKIKKFYEKHKLCMNDMNINDDNYKLFFNEINKLTLNNKNKFINLFGEYIKNIGYDNKTELFEKFYELINLILYDISIKPEVIYGDTDSVFFKMNFVNKENNKELPEREALIKSIDLGIISSIMICLLLPPPMAQEFEKVLCPFAIFSKKRYVGNLYEKNPDVYYQKSMGIVLKRRDNALIVKIVCGGIIDLIFNKKDPMGAYKFAENTLIKIYGKKYSIDKFVITKTLRTDYKNRDSIVHAVLADRMAIRDPGNKPQSNDRIPYVYIEVNKEVKLQGERVETPEYVIENNLKIDYLFYITNQIMKPAIQFLELVIYKPEKLFENYNIREINRRKNILTLGYYANNNNNNKIQSFDETMKNTIDMVNLKIPKKNIKEQINNQKKIINNNNNIDYNNDKTNINIIEQLDELNDLHIMTDVHNMLDTKKKIKKTKRTNQPKKIPINLPKIKFDFNTLF